MPTKRSTISRRPAHSRPSGFTLMEILIALSIFGAGVVMAASLFPAAGSEHQKAVEYTLGTIMCNNGVALARSQLQQNATTGVPTDPAGILTANVAYPTWKNDPPVKVVPTSTAEPLYQIKIACQHATGVKNATTGVFDNLYLVTVTPYEGGMVFPGSPGPSLAVKVPLKP